jgi:hypothetical protein
VVARWRSNSPLTKGLETTINLHKTSRLVAPLTAAAFAVLGALALSPPADAARNVFNGRIHCFDRGVDRPLVGAVVQLHTYGQDPAPISGLVKEGYTNSQGEFSLRAMNHVERYFVRVGLRSAKGVRLKDLGGLNDWAVDSNLHVNDTEERFISMTLRDYGYSHKCAVWAGRSRRLREVHQHHRQGAAVQGRAHPG